MFEDMIAFFGHEDVSKMTRSDCVRWKDHLIEKLSMKTISAVYLAAVKTVFNWALRNGHLEASPFDHVSVKVPKKIVMREQGLNDTEAAAVLKLARDYTSAVSTNPQTREDTKLSGAKHWIPWLCAFTGARVTEMSQLRKQDIRQYEDFWVIRITPDAGSVKTGRYRDIPVHRQLVAMGFLNFVKSSKDVHLFYPASAAKASPLDRARLVSSRISKWIRASKLIDDEVDPSHGWRHRFKTVTREIGIDARVADAIQGHAPRTAGEDYGEVSIKAMKIAIDKLPDYKLSG